MNPSTLERPARRRLATGLLSAAALAAGGAFGLRSGAARAADAPQPAGYPAGARVALIVPFAPGGTTDLVARLVAQALSARWGSPVIVENRPGAGGNIAAEYVARARPDGLNLLIGATSFANAPALNRQLRYDVVQDFAPISMIATTPLVMMVSNQSGIRTVQDLAARLKARPDGLNYGSSGVGTSIHLSTLMLLNRLDARAVHVVYKGSGPALTALASGEIDLLFDNYATAMPFVTGGQVRGIALTSARRGNLKTELPTLAELGFENFESLTWIGMLAPAKTPQPVVSWLNTEVQTVLKEPDMRARLIEMGFTTMPTTSKQMGDFVVSELAKTRRLVEVNRLPVE